MRGPALLLDVHSLVHRAHHALPPMNTERGEPTAALYGFSTVLVKLLRERAPSGLGLAFDSGSRRRRAVDPGYKASRRPPPAELAAQLSRVRALPDHIGAPALRIDGEEADDVLATAARELAAAGQQVLVVSGDRDLLQIARPGVSILFVGRRGGAHEEYDAAAVERRFGVPPAALPDLRAFLGDPADDLPGLSGVGPTIAARWIREHGDIDGVLARAGELAPAHLRERVQAAADRLRQVAQLGRLVDDLPLPPGPRVVEWNHDTRARLRSWFEALEFRSLVPRLG
ncbi:MAG TPA: 5'-3' exonuclease [Kofleriaceae bacterium]|nr:5'-3' exonuclease [Kofleriaceae bacterium]